MKGYDTLWIPGSDHAGIATQNIVEKHLLTQEGVSRTSLGREDFLKRVWDWKSEKGSVILNQLRLLGASLDWDRTFFTMDEIRSRAVSEAFIKLYNKGLIYRSDYLVNWSCTLASAISDIEVDHLPVTGKTNLKIPGYDKPVAVGLMYDVSYQLKTPLNGLNNIIISTTRPETILGDVAVAVHPEDERYSFIIGCELEHPLKPGSYLPVVADDFVDPNFGTGAVKITPAHDPTDFEVGKKLGLPFINILNSDGYIETPDYPEYQGLHRFEVREKILTTLKKTGRLKGCKDHPMNVPICSRTGDIIEKLLIPQWFLKVSHMIDRLDKQIKAGEVQFTPQYNEKVWKSWTKKVDWCLSRQLWWGHRIPMWRCVLDDGTKKWVPGTTLKEITDNVPRLVSAEQDEDVLDTWFSSGLLPFSVFGWPNEINSRYPISIMETGKDILFFWVARMLMLSQELKGCLPFKDILLHGMICDSHGRKMSKSVGNVIDPLYIINGISHQKMQDNIQTMKGYFSPEEMKKAISGLKKEFPNGIPTCGTDALRFGLLAYDIKAEMISLDMKHIQNSNKFCNKMWQLSRFLVLSIKKKPLSISTKSNLSLSLADKWILSKCATTVLSVNASLASNEFHEATRTLKHFLQSNLCDIYLEIIKPSMANPKSAEFEETLRTLSKVVKTGMKLLHPFMPFITEEIYQRILALEEKDSNIVESIMIKKYPSSDEWEGFVYASEEKSMNIALEAVYFIRSTKSIYNLSKHQIPKVFINSSDNLEPYKEIISTLSKCSKEDISISERLENSSSRFVVESTLPGENNYIQIDLTELINIEYEIEKATKKIKKIENEISKINKLFKKASEEESLKKLSQKRNNLSLEMESTLSTKTKLKNCL